MSFDIQESRDLADIKETLRELLDEAKRVRELIQDAQAAKPKFGDVIFRKVGIKDDE